MNLAGINHFLWLSSQHITTTDEQLLLEKEFANQGHAIRVFMTENQRPEFIIDLDFQNLDLKEVHALGFSDNFTTILHRCKVNRVEMIRIDDVGFLSHEMSVVRDHRMNDIEQE